MECRDKEERLVVEDRVIDASSCRAIGVQVCALERKEAGSVLPVRFENNGTLCQVGDNTLIFACSTNGRFFMYDIKDRRTTDYPVKREWGGPLEAIAFPGNKGYFALNFMRYFVIKNKKREIIKEVPHVLGYFPLDVLPQGDMVIHRTDDQGSLWGVNYDCGVTSWSMSMRNVVHPLVFVEDRMFLCCDKEGVVIAYKIVEEGGKLSVTTSGFMREKLEPIERIVGSPSGRVLALKSATQVCIVDVQQRAILEKCDIDPTVFNEDARMCFSSDGTYFAITSFLGFVQVYRASG